MAMRIKCPSCATVLQLGDTVAPGSSIRCPKCATVLRAPAASSPAAKPSVPEVLPAKKPAAPAPARPSKAVQAAPSQPATTKPRSGDAVSAIQQGLSDMPVPIKPKSKKGILFVILGCAGLAFLLCGGMATFAIYRLYSAGKDFANKAQERVQNAEQEWQKQVEKSQADSAKTIEEEKKKNTLPVGPNRPENKQPGGDQNLPVNPRPPVDPLPPDNPPGGQRLDLSYIAADFNAALVLHPARLLQAKSSLMPQGEMRDQMLDSILKETGIDPRQVESVVLVMEPFPGGVPTPGPRPGPAPPGPEVADDWKPFADQAGRFSVLFPGAPVQSTDPAQPGIGPTHIFLLEIPGGNRYMVRYNDLPAASATAAALQKILNDFPKQFGRELKGSKRIELDGNPGVEVELEKKQGRQTTVTTGRMYLVKRRMYQLMAVAPKDKKDPAQFAKFLDSFKLRKPGDPPVRAEPPRGKRVVDDPPRPAGGGSNVLFMPGGIIRFTAPVDGRDILNKVLKDMELGPTKNYYRSRTEEIAKVPLAGSIADNRTILLAPETTLKKMLGAQNVNSPLIARLRQLDVNHDVAGFFVVGPYKVALAELSKQPNIPPQLEALKKLDRDLEAISFTVDVDSDKMIQLVLHGTSAQASQSLETLVRNALDMGKQMYAQIKPAMQNELSKELPPDTANRFMKLVDHIAGNGIAIQRDNKNKVTITLQKPPD